MILEGQEDCDVQGCKAVISDEYGNTYDTQIE